MTLPDLSLSLVDSVDSASEFLRWLGERRPCLAVDTETTGLSWFDTTRLVQFGDGQGGWAVPLHSWRGVAEAGLAAVRDGGAPVIFHNSGYDLHKLENDGLPIPAASQVEDTLILSRLKDPHLPAGLKALCARLYGREAVAGQELLSQRMRENKWTWATVPDTLPEYWAYGVLDTCLTALAFDALRPLVPSQAYEREMAVLSVCYRAERRGMRLDVAYTEDLARQWEEEASSLRTELQAFGIENPGSDHQVTLTLKAAGWEPQEFTETGLPRLDKTVLAGLEGTRYAPVAAPLIRYRRVTKWKSTYLDTFLRDRDSDDRIHPEINTLAAKTGRMSIRNPALQTLPSGDNSVRRCFLPNADDERIYSIDYDNMEMKIFASYTGDPALIAAAKTEDFHRSTAAMVYGVPESEVTKEQRTISKGVNFGNVYGAGPAKIAETAGVSEAEAVEFLQAFDRRFPGAAVFKGEVDHAAKVRLAVDGEAWITTSGGRRAVCEPDKIYSLVNFICQGSGADVVKDAMIAMDCAGLGDYLLIPVHDEVVLSLPQGEEGATLVEQTKDAMEDLTGFRVPLTCSVKGPLPRWGGEVEA